MTPVEAPGRTAARKPLVLIPQYFGGLAFDHRTSKYLPFDAEATALLRRLSSTSFDAVLDETADTAERDALTRFFDQFYALGFFTTDLRFAGETLDVTPPADHLVGPLATHLEVVAACNLRCVHCFAGELPRKEQALTLDELDRLFADMARMGSFRLGLTGGEPLLRHDLFEIIDLATAHGLHPCVTTNGLHITENIARAFGKRDLVWLNVSLEGATAATNDRIRGEGVFDRVIERLKILARHAHFTLAFTIMSANAHEVEACAELAYRVGADIAVFRPLYPVGTARQHLDLMPTFAQYSDALDDLAQGSLDHLYELRSVDPFSPQTRQAAQAKIHQNLGCGAGNLICSISLSGDVNPCSFLGPAYAAANLRDASLHDIWHSSQGFQQMRALPDTESGGAAFGGGCRARALVYNGSVNAPDPWLAGQESRRVHPLSLIEVTRRREWARPKAGG